MYLKDVLNRCREEGYPITASGLYYAGKKFNFIVKREGNRNLEFDKEAFFKWLNKAKEEIPEGWLPLCEIAKLFKISLSQAYILAKDKNSGARGFGAGEGVIYVDPKRIKEIIKQREDSHKEKWED